jgi:hypothetical protein
MSCWNVSPGKQHADRRTKCPLLGKSGRRVYEYTA